MILPPNDGTIAPRELGGWMMSEGIPFASSREISGWVGCEPSEVSTVLRGAREAGTMMCVTTSGWATGLSNSPDVVVDAMMRYLEHPYYLGFMRASEFHSAAYLGSRVTTVVTPARLSSRKLGDRWQIRFVQRYRPGVPTVRLPGSCEFPNIKVTVCSPDVLLMDVVSRPKYAGSMYNVCTIIGQLLERYDGALFGDFDRPTIAPDSLAEAAKLYTIADRQRAGYLIESVIDEWIDVNFDLGPLRRTIPRLPGFVDLQPNAPREFEQWMDHLVLRKPHVSQTWRVKRHAVLESDL